MAEEKGLSFNDIYFVEESRFNTEKAARLFSEAKTIIDRHLSPPYPLEEGIKIDIGFSLPETVIENIIREYQEVGWNVSCHKENGKVFFLFE